MPGTVAAVALSLVLSVSRSRPCVTIFGMPKLPLLVDSSQLAPKMVDGLSAERPKLSHWHTTPAGALAGGAQTNASPTAKSVGVLNAPVTPLTTIEVAVPPENAGSGTTQPPRYSATMK